MMSRHVCVVVLCTRALRQILYIIKITDRRAVFVSSSSSSSSLHGFVSQQRSAYSAWIPGIVRVDEKSRAFDGKKKKITIIIEIISGLRCWTGDGGVDKTLPPRHRYAHLYVIRTHAAVTRLDPYTHSFSVLSFLLRNAAAVPPYH